MIHGRTFESFPYTNRAAETPFKKEKDGKIGEPSKCKRV